MVRLANRSVTTLAEFRRTVDALVWGGQLAKGEQVRITLAGDFLDPNTGEPKPEMVALAEDAISIDARPCNVFASIRGKWANLPELCCDIAREKDVDW